MFFDKTRNLFILAFCLLFIIVTFAQAKSSFKLASAGRVPQHKAAPGTVKDAQKEVVPEQIEYVGEIFGVKVPANNYYFIRNALIVFGNRRGPQPKTEKELEEVVWEQLVLSFLAYQENIVVDQDELEKEVGKTIASAGANFDRKKDTKAYEAWLKEKVNEPPAIFESQIRHLLQLEKLRTYIMGKIEPPVDDAEAQQVFFNEAGRLSIELVFFDEESQAEEFYKKVSRRANVWEQEKKKRPGDFKAPGAVSIAYLVDLWGIPQDAATKMMKKKTGEFYPPRPVHTKFAVFKILDKRAADNKDYAKSKEAYFEKVKLQKKFEGYKTWLKNVKQAANIKIYPPPVLPEQSTATAENHSTALNVTQ
ncbi:MAG: hypothetical protein PHV55_05470 [Candidatus Omnitrophica bacterium]|nr:hypothetical protein [Candidatus Omnitrophota bacterium]